jgi:hypothetical protein
MKSRFPLLFIAAFITLIACNSKKTSTPLQVNQHFASISDSLWNYGINYATALKQALQDKNFTTLTPLRLKIQSFAQRKRTELSTMKDVKDSKDFRLAMLSFLDFEIDMTNKIVAMESLSASTPQEEIDAAVQNLIETGRKESKYVNDVRAAQSIYAHNNGFAIAPLATPTGK